MFQFALFRKGLRYIMKKVCAILQMFALQRKGQVSVISQRFSLFRKFLYYYNAKGLRHFTNGCVTLQRFAFKANMVGPFEK